MFEMLIPMLMGLYQTIKGSQLAKQTRPTMTMPSGITAGENIHKDLAGGDMPGLSEAQQDIQSGAAAQFNRMKESTGSSASLLGGGANLNYGTSKAIQKLFTENADWQTKQQQGLAGYESGVVAPMQNQVWQYNYAQPYQEKQYAGSSLIGGGIQNMFGALSAYAQSQNPMNKLMQQYLKQMMGLGGNKGGDENQLDPYGFGIGTLGANYQ